jgi:hypothetical protein
MTVADPRLVAELSLLVRARVPARAVRRTIRDAVMTQIGRAPCGPTSVVEAVERTLRAAFQVQRESAGPGELIEVVYVASLEAVRGHGGETARWVADARRRAQAVLNEMAVPGVEPLWARRIQDVDGWERW